MRIILITILIISMLAILGCAENIELNSSNIDKYRGHYVSCNITLSKDLGSCNNQETELRPVTTYGLGFDGKIGLHTTLVSYPITRTYRVFDAEEGIRVAILESEMEGVFTPAQMKVTGFVGTLEEYPGSTLIIRQY